TALGTRQVDTLAPDDRSGAGHAWQRRLPDDVRFRVPVRGQPGFVADAVVIRAAPLGPVLGPREGRAGDQAAGEQPAGKGEAFHGSVPFFEGGHPNGGGRRGRIPDSPIVTALPHGTQWLSSTFHQLARIR